VVAGTGAGAGAGLFAAEANAEPPTASAATAASPAMSFVILERMWCLPFVGFHGPAPRR
jgi:hypothetical protein